MLERKIYFLNFQNDRFLFYGHRMENLKHLKGCYEIQNFDNFFGHPKRGSNCPQAVSNHLEIGRKIKKLSRF